MRTRLGFNPHPAHRPGATRTGLRGAQGYFSFNPHPAHRPGATFNGYPLLLLCGVSILTRHTGRVLRYSPLRVPWLTRFNPHPAHRPGATRVHRVPIASVTCFNPHPAHRPGATLIYAVYRSRDRFQSSPGTQAGCYWDICNSISEVESFNPHPAHRPGATFRVCIVVFIVKVSILTRHTGRVLLSSPLHHLQRFRVSILTRHTGRVLR